MRVFLALGLWLALAVFAMANGAVAERFVVPRAGEYGAHVYKSVTMIAAIAIAAFLYAMAAPAGRRVRAGLLTGLLWAVLTVAFEFLVVLPVVDAPVERLLADWRLDRGRLWPLVVLATAILPAIAGALVERSRPSA